MTETTAGILLLAIVVFVCVGIAGMFGWLLWVTRPPKPRKKSPARTRRTSPRRTTRTSPARRPTA